LLAPRSYRVRSQDQLFQIPSLLQIFISEHGFICGNVAVGDLVTNEAEKGGEDVLDTPTVAPTTWREGLGIQEYLHDYLRENGYEEEAPLDPTSSVFRAVNWILHHDPRQLDTADVDLIQRFLHGLLLFSPGGALPGEGSPSSWLSCNPPALAKMDDYFCYFNRLENLNTYTSVPAVQWLSGNHECGWAGVTCDEYNHTWGLQLGRYRTLVKWRGTPIADLLTWTNLLIGRRSLDFVVVNICFQLRCVRGAKSHRTNAFRTLLLSISPGCAINVEPVERNPPRN
jgi:hypothetical protein